MAPDRETGTSEWSLRRATGRSLELLVAVGSPGCYEYESIQVSESASAVEITTRVKHERNVDCNDSLAFKEVRVALDEPLGERKLTGCKPRDVLVRGRDDRAAPCDRPLAAP
jgi:hypothetical protein